MAKRTGRPSAHALCLRQPGSAPTHLPSTKAVLKHTTMRMFCFGRQLFGRGIPLGLAKASIGLGSHVLFQNNMVLAADAERDLDGGALVLPDVRLPKHGELVKALQCAHDFDAHPPTAAGKDAEALDLGSWSFDARLDDSIIAKLRDKTTIASLLENYMRTLQSGERVDAHPEIVHMGEHANRQALPKLNLAHMSPLLGASQTGMSTVSGMQSCVARHRRIALAHRAPDPRAPRRLV